MSADAPETSARARVLGYALVAYAAIGWGTWPLILKWSAKGGKIDAFAQAPIVMAVLTLGGGVGMLRDRIPVRATRAQWLAIAWLGVGDAINVLCFFAAYEKTNVAIAVLTHYLAPIFVAMFAPAIARERPRLAVYFAAVISFVGLAVLLKPWGEGLSAKDVAGAAYGATSAIFYANNVLVNKRLVRVFSAAELMFFHGLVALPILFVFAPRHELLTIPPRALGPLLFGALVPGVIGGLVFVWGLKRVPATNASILTLLEPLSAVVLAALVLGERVGAHTAVGALLILGGAAIVLRPPPKN